jgi:hypothetical protein
MSADKQLPPKRRVVVWMTARDKNDPIALLAAVRNRLLGEGICIEVRTVGQVGPTLKPPKPLADPAADPPAVVTDDVLETKVRELAIAVLDAAEKKAEEEGVEAERNAERTRAENEAQQAGLRSYLSYWFGQGVRITVEIYEKSVGAVVGVVSRGLGGKGE